MLRRKPTAIGLTPDVVQEYEAFKQKAEEVERQEKRQAAAKSREEASSELDRSIEEERAADEGVEVSRRHVVASRIGLRDS